MGKTNYTYAVARIRVLETALFTSAVIEQLLACRTEEQCIQFLQEKGWGDMNTSESAEAILNREQEKIWETIRELGVDMKVFDVLSYPNLFHNLKAAIKDACTEEHGKNLNIYYEDTSISPDEMLEIVKNKEFSRLPAFMAEAAREAYEVLLHTRDGQLWTKRCWRQSMLQEKKLRTALSRIMQNLRLQLLILKLLCVHRKRQKPWTL